MIGEDEGVGPGTLLGVPRPPVQIDPPYELRDEPTITEYWADHDFLLIGQKPDFDLYDPGTDVSFYNGIYRYSWRVSESLQTLVGYGLQKKSIEVHRLQDMVNLDVLLFQTDLDLLDRVFEVSVRDLVSSIERALKRIPKDTRTGRELRYLLKVDFGDKMTAPARRARAMACRSIDCHPDKYKKHENGEIGVLRVLALELLRDAWLRSGGEPTEREARWNQGQAGFRQECIRIKAEKQAAQSAKAATESKEKPPKQKPE